MTGNNNNGNGGIKITLPWAAVITVLIGVIGWMGSMQVGLADRPKRDEVKTTAVETVAAKAEREDVVRLQEQLKRVLEKLENQEKKLDRLLERGN